MRLTMRRLLPAAALGLAVGGCSLFGDDKKSEAPSAASETSSESTTEDFPNLASVPDQPPPSTPKVEREKLVQGLLADRAHAEYSGEALGEETANVRAAAPPPAPPPPEPDPPAEEGEAATAPTEDPNLEPLPPTPAEVAALPADLGQPTALIYFAGDSASLTDRDRAILGDVATLYTRERGSRVRVIGHGSAGDGAELALARADAVAKTLMGMGVPATALETATGGPTYDESQPTGVAANRRVEVYIGS